MSVQEWNRNYDRQKQDGVIERITSAYNFVPLSETIVFPDWAGQISQDYPFEDGVCGTLQLTINSHSPLLLGTKQDREVKPFYLPDGTATIPGSSLRGMIRNVLEIAGFGKMRLADDKRYGVRDLQADFYKKQLTKDGGKNRYIPQSQAGWLNFKDGEWTITPCQVARVERSLLESYLGKFWVKISDKDRPTSEGKYAAWLKAGKSLAVDFNADGMTFHPHRKGAIQLQYSKVSKIGSGSEQGSLVFTGQPGPQKHMEFVFYREDASRSFTVPERIMRDFQHIYQDSGDWKYLKQMDSLLGIPVFYLEQSGKISSLGLSQMYRLAYRQSIGEIIDHANAGHRQNNRPDLAELIFGTIDETDGKESLKGRVSFSHAVCQTPPPYREQACTAILNSPKPTYYPNYVVQDEENGKLKGRDYRTYMDANAQIRGWKRYPVKTAITVPQLDRDQLAGGAWSKLYPLNGPLRFQAKLRFHNLRPVELGAIAWCLDWGGNPALRHSIGMGKPFGFGQITISLDKRDIRPNKLGEDMSLEKCVEDFIGFMNEALGHDWLSDENMQHLLAMAEPDNAVGHALIPLDLCGGGRENQFVNAKRASLVLESYILPKAPELSGEVKWLEDNLAELSKQTNTPLERVLFTLGLAERWQAMEDVEKKIKVKALIKRRWQDKWDDPAGKKTIAARKIYGDEL